MRVFQRGHQHLASLGATLLLQLKIFPLIILLWENSYCRLKRSAKVS
jgi:hypothetical protein